MRYDDARQKISTGDLIAFRNRKKVFSRIVSRVTRSPYTHTAIAAWSGFSGDDRLLIVESNATGASLSPLSSYKDIDFDVFTCPVDRRRVERELLDLVGSTKIHYDVPDLIRIALNKLIGWPLPVQDDDALVCSALSATIYRLAQWRPVGLPSIPAPSDVVAALHAAPLCEVRRD